MVAWLYALANLSGGACLAGSRADQCGNVPLYHALSTPAADV